MNSTDYSSPRMQAAGPEFACSPFYRFFFRPRKSRMAQMNNKPPEPMIIVIWGGGQWGRFSTMRTVQSLFLSMELSWVGESSIAKKGTDNVHRGPQKRGTSMALCCEKRKQAHNTHTKACSRNKKRPQITTADGRSRARERRRKKRQKLTLQSARIRKWYRGKESPGSPN